MDGDYLRLLDPRLRDAPYDPQQLQNVLMLAILCLSPNPAERPRMDEVHTWGPARPAAGSPAGPFWHKLPSSREKPGPCCPAQWPLLSGSMNALAALWSLLVLWHFALQPCACMGLVRGQCSPPYEDLCPLRVFRFVCGLACRLFTYWGKLFTRMDLTAIHDAPQPSFSDFQWFTVLYSNTIVLLWYYNIAVAAS